MKVSYCTRHQTGGLYQDRQCMASRCIVLEGDSSGRCEMVEMQLVPADARMVNENEVVIVIPEGQYLASFTIAPVVDEQSFRMKVVSVSDPPEAEPPPKDPWDYDP